MKIIELRSENIKNLKVIEIHPDGSVVLEGKNGAGKSAVIDSIFMALTGKKIEQPIRNGEDRAEINIDLGEYKVKKIFTAKGERLEVTSTKGASFKSPQTMLNEILGNLAFDPLKFAELGRSVAGQREQRNVLADLVGLDFTELDKKREELYDERTIKHREIKGADMTAHRPDPKAPLPLEALVAKMAKPAASTSRQEISMAEEIAKVEVLEAKMKAYRKYENEVQEVLEYKTNCEIDIIAKQEEIKELQGRISLLERDISNLTINAQKAQQDAEAIPAPEKVIEQQIADARAMLVEVETKNIEIRAAIEFDKKFAELEAARKMIAGLEAEMMKIDLEKQDRVNAAKFPIEGLGITDQCVTYNGKPFSQLSTGEQIRVSTAVAMALNPQLRVILIREGSLLDKEGREEVFRLAQEKDYQVWMECVADSKQCGIYLENGEIK